MHLKQFNDLHSCLPVTERCHAIQMTLALFIAAHIWVTDFTGNDVFFLLFSNAGVNIDNNLIIIIVKNISNLSSVMRKFGQVTVVKKQKSMERKLNYSYKTVNICFSLSLLSSCVPA